YSRTKKDILNTLEDLKHEEFKKFKWYLKQPNILEGYETIKESKLEKAKRRDTVDLMVNTFDLDGALKVTKKVLEKINRNDLVQSLPDSSSGQSHFIYLYFRSDEQTLSARPGMVSGLAAFRGFVLLREERTSTGDTESGVSSMPPLARISPCQLAMRASKRA
uniref:Pyrin domain-containing protein n=1 Tax=Dicentrarchus labrax TaxID=13489 RepID=A0A8C4DL10_DICLA